MTSNSDIDNEIIQEVRLETVQKYRDFITHLSEDVDLLNRKLQIDNYFFRGLESITFLDDSTSQIISENDNPLIQEHTDYFELLQTCGNMQLNKLLLVFATLVEELNTLASSAKQFIHPLQLYRDNIDSENEFTPIANLLPMLFELICYLKRAYQVSSNLILQKHSLLSFATAKRQDPEFNSKLKEILPVLNSHLRFDLVWSAFGNMCTAIVTLDNVFSSQMNTIRRDIYNYKRSLEMSLKNPKQFQIEEHIKEMEAILALIAEVEHELIDGHVIGVQPTGPKSAQDIDFLFFKGIVYSILNTNFAENNALSKNEPLRDNFIQYFNQILNDIEKCHCDFIEDQRLLSLCFIYSVYVHLFWKDSDFKIARNLLECQKKLNINFVHLNGNISLSPDQVLIHLLPKGILDKKILDQLVSCRENLMKPNELETSIKTLSLSICTWLTTIEHSFDSGLYNTSSDGNVIQLIFEHIQLLKHGFEYIRQLSSTIRSAIAIHYQTNKSMSKTDSIALCKGVNLLKGIQKMFVKQKNMIIIVVQHFQKYNACALLKILTRNKKKLIETSLENYSEEKLDLLSAIILASNCLNGPVLTLKRFTIIWLALSYLNPYSSLFTNDDLLKIKILVQQLQFFVNIFSKVRKLFSCEFLYYNRALIGVYFDSFYKSYSHSQAPPIRSEELQYFLYALNDSVVMLKNVDKLMNDNESQLAGKYTDEIYGYLKTKVLEPLCKDFEDELRLQTHTHLKVNKKDDNVLKNCMDFQGLLSCEPLKLCDKRIILIKKYVENHFNRLAYNMTAIALYDWKTYENILLFANNKYGLEFACLQLPTQTLEQGLDVLEITRNLSIFINLYQYNLNQQFFVEKVSQNKHLNVLTIRHISNSIQTHGFGIINSAVNFAYQFLKNKFQILSKFLYEDHIKSRLIKDIKLLNDLLNNKEKDNDNVKYPYERAEKFVKSIKKLGVNKDGASYLDKFRVLLTQIGNILGFIRMLRSGALHCNTELANFLPDLDDINQQFAELIKDEGLEFSQESIEAAENIDNILQNVSKNFSDSHDYLMMLVKIFRETLNKNDKNVHLKNFYVIVPAMTLNYVDYILISKGKLLRKNKIDEGAVFTDDGFVMGITYTLTVLKQFDNFNTLQWFSSVDDHIQPQIDSNNPGQTGRTFNLFSKENDSDTQTASLTLRRLQELHTEFNLLKFNMTSCRILFHSNQEADC